MLIPEGSAPSAFSPDGTQLLLRRFQQRPGNSDLAIARVVRTNSGLSVEDRREYLATPNSSCTQARSLPTASGSPTCRAEGGTYEVFVRAVPDTGSALPRLAEHRQLSRLVSHGAGTVLPVRQRSDHWCPGDATRSGAFIPEPPKPWGSRRLEGLTTNRLFDLHSDGRRIVGVVSASGDGARPNGRVTFLLNFKDELRRRVPLP